MRPLAAAQALEVCERGRDLPPVQRALLLLKAGSPDEPAERLAALPIGRRDARLLDLRARMFGCALETETHCPSCGQRLELDVSSDDLRAAAPQASPEGPEPLTLHHDGYQLVVRLPTSEDLVESGDGEGAEARLLARCVVEARSDGVTIAPEDLPTSVVAAVGEAMAAADPLADVQLAVTCPACAHDWSAPFDPATFLWTELERWVPHLLREVHLLASAYGWPEGDILAMSAWRRGQYLRLLSA